MTCWTFPRLRLQPQGAACSGRGEHLPSARLLRRELKGPARSHWCKTSEKCVLIHFDSFRFQLTSTQKQTRSYNNEYCTFEYATTFVLPRNLHLLVDKQIMRKHLAWKTSLSNCIIFYLSLYTHFAKQSATRWSDGQHVKFTVQIIHQSFQSSRFS